MHHRIIKANEAKRTIESYLADVEDRSTSIALLSLEEVTVYINAVIRKKLEKENKKMQAQIDTLQLEKRHHTEAEVHAKHQVEEQKAEISRLKEITKVEVKRRYLVDIISTYKSDSYSLLFSNTTKTIEALTKLSLIDQEFITLYQVKNCIEEAHLKVFDKPHTYLDASLFLLNNTQKLVRDVSLLFRQPNVLTLEVKGQPTL